MSHGFPEKVQKVILRQASIPAWRKRHPWLYTGSIADAPSDLVPGQIVALYSPDQKHQGYAFWENRANLACLAFLWETHDNPTRPVFWHKVWHNALTLRQKAPSLQNTNAFRLLHGESDGCPGLIVDVYDNVAVVQTRSTGAQRLLPWLKDFLRDTLTISYLYIKQKNAGYWMDETYPQAGLWIQENHLSFWVSWQGQKTGLFLDQRDNRQLCSLYIQNRRVLDLFSYTGAFSLYALKNGAQTVVSVDTSQKALSILQKNLQKNRMTESCEIHCQDAFTYLHRIKKADFDFIISDPPAFAKKPSEVPAAQRGYRELHRQLLSKIAPHGYLATFSCSQAVNAELFRQTLYHAASEIGRTVQILRFFHAAEDHPVSIYFPEGEYLKGFLVKVF
ncbi:MAG: class I SAM-dependent rRNA methyltransferase [Bacteroidia bacterium]